MLIALLVTLLLAHGAGAGSALVLRGAAGRAGVAGCALLGSLAALALGVLGLLGGRFTLVAPVLPLTGLALRLDGLGAFFLAVIGLVGAAASVYGFGYSEPHERRGLGLLGSMLNALLLSMSIQVLADNALTFLVAWEVMSLSAYLLVLSEHDQPGAVRSAHWYLAVTHAGFAALVAMFFLLAGSDLTASFATMRTATLGPTLRHVIFLLALFGFATKAGLVPLHVWLPMAHPVAPSHVSALMSGVVIKMGVYGFLRIVLDVMGGAPAWWGVVVLALGTVSALLGVLYALMEHDLKRLLAYHSVENVGIIFIGIGAGLIFHTYGLPALALLGLVGGLYHTVNHASFKGLLFLGAGSVLHATHTRNMEELGGLIKRMPRTAIAFLVGSAAISALPPLNGFTSEWLVFQALLGSARIADRTPAVLMPVAVGLLALTSGLAAACVVKAFGITFLAIPRSEEAAHAHEAPGSMQAGMGALVLACVALGLAPVVVVPLIGRALAGLGGLPATPPSFVLGLSLNTPDGVGQMSPIALAVGLGLVMVATVVALRVVRASRRLRVSDTWGCGRIGQTPRMQYTATAFAEPLRRVFAELYRPSEDLSIDFHPASRYFVQSIAYHSEVRPWLERLVYGPVIALLRGAALRVRWIQAGSLHLYLVYMGLGLVVLLLLARWTP